MEKTEACNVIVNGLELLEQDRSRWACGGYLIFNNDKWCACALGAAYLAKRYGKMLDEVDFFAEERPLDEFMDEIGMALGTDAIKAIIDTNDKMHLDGASFSSFRMQMGALLDVIKIPQETE